MLTREAPRITVGIIFTGMNVSPTLSQCDIVTTDEHGQVQFACQAVAVGERLGNLKTRIDVHQGERHMAEERLARQPQEHRRILAHRPQHAEISEMTVRLAQDIHALLFQGSETIHQETPCQCGPASADMIP